MSLSASSKIKGTDIRAGLNHPVVDADGHVVEATPVILDFIKQVAGREMADRYIQFTQSFIRPNAPRKSFWLAPSGPNTIDRATAMLPRLFRARLDDAGIDVSLVYTSQGLSVAQIPDAELRIAAHRAYNMMYADIFSECKDRLIPAAIIPANTPEEALNELDYAVNELGFRLILLNTIVMRPDAEIARETPHLAQNVMQPFSVAMDNPYDFDPVWEKCIELGVAPACHNVIQGYGTTRSSPSNYVFNQMGSFAAGSEFFCRSLFFGGVTRRFPGLKFAFLEGGVGWAAQFYNSLFEYWEKRNIDTLLETLDPEKLDMELMREMAEKFGDSTLSAEKVLSSSPYWSTSKNIDRDTIDDFSAIEIEKKQDIYERFIPNFYFGCEADDRLNSIAFDTKLNRMGARLKVMMGSDIGHWDVPDMTQVLVEAHEMVEDGLCTDDDFREFVFTNVVELHTSMNPDFFSGTVLEGDVKSVTSNFTSA